MSSISDHQHRRDEQSLARVLFLVNIALLVVLFTVSYLQR